MFPSGFTNGGKPILKVDMSPHHDSLAGTTLTTRLPPLGGGTIATPGIGTHVPIIQTAAAAAQLEQPEQHTACPTIHSNIYTSGSGSNMNPQNAYEDFTLFPSSASDPFGNFDEEVVSRSQFEQLQGQLQDISARLTQVEGNVAMLSPTVPRTMGFNRNGLPQYPVDNEVEDDYEAESVSPLARRFSSRRERFADLGSSTTTSGRVTKKKSRMQLSIAIPSNGTAPTGGFTVHTPTPMTAGSQMSPYLMSPATPNLIGPFKINKKAKSCPQNLKRAFHNLDKIMPPPFAMIPILPLTDTEMIVFFYQSTARPPVACRLYDRGWQPSSIVSLLNDFRQIDPPYLRNTCSVKCTSAIKKGVDLHGNQWREDIRAAFRAADDLEATNMCRLARDELGKFEDFDLRHFNVGLKKLPQVGTEGGIFTQCVQYAIDNDVQYTLDTVWQLAEDLQAGRTPMGGNPQLRPDNDALTRKNANSQNQGEQVVEEPQVTAFEDLASVDAPNSNTLRGSTPDSVLGEFCNFENFT